MRSVVGLDFGTTNSAICVVTPDGRPRLAQFDLAGDLAGESTGRTPTFRSLLYIRPNERDPELPPQILAGPRAIEAYLLADGPGRLIQSTKSFLASRHFAPTDVFGFDFELEDLISFILKELREAAEAQFGELSGTVVVGRPVRFVNAKTARDDKFALGRLESALRRAGFDEVVFEYEPVAAAYHYATRLDDEEIVLIADFGGGTSDFSLLRLQPGHGTDGTDPGRLGNEILGTAGVATAGDDFDAKFVRHIVAPRLGRGSEYESLFGTRLNVPRWIYSHLERWHHLSFLRSPKAMRVLLDLRKAAIDPKPIEALIHILEAERGYSLYRAVERTKYTLSTETTAEFVFSDPPAVFAANVSRAEFESWIAEEMAEITDCVEGLLAQAGVTPDRVDRVFLTGGSSFVPIVRRLFEDRFHRERIRRGAELTSVVSGLGLRALSLTT